MAAKKQAVKKTSAKKTTAKKTARKASATVTTKKSPAKRSSTAGSANGAAKPARKLTAIKEPMKRTAIYEEIADVTGLTKRDVKAVLDALSGLIARHLSKRAAGQFTLPGLLKLQTIKKPAQKARKNVPNPFKPGETMDVAAKPATVKVRALPLKKIKDMALQ